MAANSDRRRIQRVHLDSPLAARLETMKAVVTDISSVGAKIEHDQPLPRSRSRQIPLEFSCDGESVTLACDIIRSKYEQREDRAVYCSGVRFSEPEDPTVQTLREMISRLIERDLEARKAHLIRVKG